MLDKNIDLKELKKIELELLIAVDSICRRNNIRYSLAYGTLLGAIRHKGYIPWDDDIDICMPRPDFERFVQYCGNNDVPFELLSSESDKQYINLISKICAKGTNIIEKNTNRFQNKIGVYIDIFPIEGLGNNEKIAIKNFRKSTIYREVLNASLWKKYFTSKTHSLFYEPLRIILFCISRFVSPYKLLKKIIDIYRDINYDEVRYIGVIGSPYRKRDIFDRYILEEFIDIEFEGHIFKAFKNYDKYLKQIYGDYMILPPKEKRTTHHTFTAYYE